MDWIDHGFVWILFLFIVALVVYSYLFIVMVCIPSINDRIDLILKKKNKRYPRLRWPPVN